MRCLKFRGAPTLHMALIILCLTVASLAVSGCKQQAQQSTPEQTQKDERPIMRIAFVGNEYSSTNNMANMVQLLAQSDPSSHFNVEIGTYFKAEANLAHLIKTPAVKTLFPQNKWDYVVLQPHSLWAATEGHVYSSQKSISVWARYLHGVRAQPVLFMTWPLERHHSTYADLKYMSSLKNYKNMHRMIRGYSKAMSKNNDMLIAPVGDYWMIAMEAAPGLAIYGDDGSLPTVAGSYLTALVIYKTLIDSTIDDITYIPEGMDEATQKALVAIASKKIEN